jgi:hypothetical protein
MLPNDKTCWDIRPMLTFSIFKSLDRDASDEVHFGAYTAIRQDNPANILYIGLIATHHVTHLEVK